MNKVVYLFVIAALLGGCATAPTLGEKSASLTVGMSQESVRKILGHPRTTSVQKLADGLEEKWIYWSQKNVGYAVYDDPSMAGQENRLTVTFKNGVLDSWSSRLNSSGTRVQTRRTIKITSKDGAASLTK